MTRIARALNSSRSRLSQMRQMEVDGIDRKQIARAFGICQARVTQLLGRKYPQSARKTRVCWYAMIRRCTNPKFPNYKFWGGRGIKVCDRWLVFENFLADMGEAPTDRSLDRINNDGDYEPSNCRWATRHEQLTNRSNNNRLTVDGISKTITDWARDLGVSAECVRTRIERGWDAKRAVTTPSQRPA